MIIKRTCLTHPLDLLQLVFARRRRGGRRGRRSVRRGRAQGRRRGPVVVLHLSLTVLRGRNRSLSPQRNQMPRYGASNHVSCFSAVSEFQGTFSGPRSVWESERTLADPSLQTLANKKAFSGHIRLLLLLPQSRAPSRLHNDGFGVQRGVCQRDITLSLKAEFTFMRFP